MSNALFPFPRSTGPLPGITWNLTRRPMFATKVQQAVGGQTIAAAFQPYPIWRWQLEYQFLRTYTPYAEWDLLVDFFNSRQGAFDTFLLDDPEDDSVTTMQFGTGTGSATQFQLGRTLNGGLFEPIYNLNGAPSIFVNGVLKTAGVDYNIAAGLVTFTVAPAAAAALTWTGQYYWRCRFEQDSQEFAMLAQNFWSAKQVALISVLGA